MPAISPKDGPVAVTGCSGFAGGHMVRELVRHGYEVRACIRNASSWRGKDCVDYLTQLPGVEIFDGCDLYVPGSYDKAFAGASAVVHMAAVLGNSADGKSQPLGTGNSTKDTYDGAVNGAQNVIDAINASGTVKRAIFTSSLAAVKGPKGATLPKGYEWTETDWSSDDVDPDVWARYAYDGTEENAYDASKVYIEHLFNEAAEASGQWDAVTMNPAMICGPILFKAQVGQWIEQIGRIAAGEKTTWPINEDMFYNIIDVRDLVEGHRLALEADIDHRNTHGGPRYIMHGCGGRSSMRLSTEVIAVIADLFPNFELGGPAMENPDGTPVNIEYRTVNDCKKAKSVLGASTRPVEETIRDIIETSIDLGIITPKLKDTPKSIWIP